MSERKPIKRLISDMQSSLRSLISDFNDMKGDRGMTRDEWIKFCVYDWDEMQEEEA